jgi:hypothetical protein
MTAILMGEEEEDGVCLSDREQPAPAAARRTARINPGHPLRMPLIMCLL